MLLLERQKNIPIDMLDKLKMIPPPPQKKKSATKFTFIFSV